ncbi:mitochondrial ribosomal protein S16 [Oratosquilla oratoria]|uniref:mitochondrial ribosomal protein S16 n=1 Tax=Oratosquilla oratoria TaxID=337810 RepID=UPI003F764E82
MPFPASGGAKFSYAAAKAIRFAYHGCANRPFFHIVVMNKRRSRQGHVIEQLGTYDPMINSNSEKLCSLNLERINYWIGCGASISTPCAELFGLAGLIPIHPTSYIKAWRNRKLQAEEKAKESSSAEEV